MGAQHQPDASPMRRKLTRWNFVKSRPEFKIEFLGGDLRIDAGDLIGSCLRTLRHNARMPFTFEESLKINL